MWHVTDIHLCIWGQDYITMANSWYSEELSSCMSLWMSKTYIIFSFLLGNQQSFDLISYQLETCLQFLLTRFSWKVFIKSFHKMKGSEVALFVGTIFLLW